MKLNKNLLSATIGSFLLCLLLLLVLLVLRVQATTFASANEFAAQTLQPNAQVVVFQPASSFAQTFNQDFDRAFVSFRQFDSQKAVFNGNDVAFGNFDTVANNFGTDRAANFIAFQNFDYAAPAVAMEFDRGAFTNTFAGNMWEFV